MTLYIDTSDRSKITIALKTGTKNLAAKSFLAPQKQAEKLLVEIDRLLQKSKKKLTDLKQITVMDQGSSFTALRIGVLTANALAYALNIPVVSASGRKTLVKKNIRVVAPEYDRLPNIG
jgi:tRNA threonylcarbamoyladenosine biosynthesis protein TsaB